jgi:hypothetical protein
MRHIGRSMPVVNTEPSTQALRDAAIHQATGQSLAVFSSTGIRKGVYRFKSHDEADAQVQAGLIWVIARNVRLRQVVN